MASPFLNLMAKRKPMEAPIGAQEAGLLRPAASPVPGPPLQSWALPPLSERDKPVESVPSPIDLAMAAPMAVSIGKGMAGTIKGLWPLRSPIPRVGSDALPPLPMHDTPGNPIPGPGFGPHPPENMFNDARQFVGNRTPLPPLGPGRSPDDMMSVLPSLPPMPPAGPMLPPTGMVREGLSQFPTVNGSPDRLSPEFMRLSNTTGLNALKMGGDSGPPQAPVALRNYTPTRIDTAPPSVDHPRVGSMFNSVGPTESNPGGFRPSWEPYVSDVSDVRVAPSVGPMLKAAGTNPGRLRRR